MHSFVYQGMPSRVVFGAGKLHSLADELDQLGAHRALILSTPGQQSLGQRITDLLGERAAGIHPKAVMHVPIEVAQAARAEAVRLGADCCIAIGSGSTIGLGKAIAMDSGLPILAIPTTYAGSEMTTIYGLTENHRARCHTLGGTFNLPHAQTHAAVLPHAAHYNHKAAAGPLTRAARALGGEHAEDVGALLFELNRQLGIEPALSSIGLPEDGPAEAARIACASPYYNPRPFEQEAIEAMLNRALHGHPPT